MFLQIYFYKNKKKYLYKNCETLNKSTNNEKTNIKDRLKKYCLFLLVK